MKKLYSLLSLLLGIVIFIVSLLPAVREFGRFALVMTAVGAVLAGVGALELAFTARKKNRPEGTCADAPPEREPPRYERKKTYITRTEYNFLQLLRGISPDKYEVVPQVALNSVIDKLTQNSYRNELFRVVDFLFVDRVTFAPLLLVELNDSSHLRAERAERDKKVNDICCAAGMPLVTFWTHEQNDFASIRKIVLKNILKK